MIRIKPCSKVIVRRKLHGVLGRVHFCSPLLLLSCYPILSKETCPGQESPAESFDMVLLDKFFSLHLLLALASAQWWGLQRGFRPLGRIGAERGIGVPKQLSAGYFRASGSNVLRVSEPFNSWLYCECVWSCQQKGLLQFWIKQIWAKNWFLFWILRWQKTH